MRFAVEHTPVEILPPILANSGGPSSRSRVQKLETSILGRRLGRLHCPRVCRLALDFGEVDPLHAAPALVSECGFDDVEEARAVLLPGLSASLCRQAPGLLPLRVGAVEPREALRQAILLGHCTAFLFDPARPLLWTRTSLTRRLELFEGEGFYA